MSVVVTLIGLLAAIAIPSYRHLTLRSKATAVVNDLRSFATAFVTYSAQNGHWPTTSGAPGQPPPEIADAISTNFTKPSPIGGLYTWDNDSSANGFHVTASISIVTTSDSLMSDDLELLQMINDGIENDHDLSTGNLRIGSTNNLVYIIEP